MHKSLVVVLALAGCTESIEDHLEDLEDEVEVVCGEASHCTRWTTPIDEVSACMNDALTRGKVAKASWHNQDAYGWYIPTYVFAVDHRVTVFRSVPDYDGEYDLEEKPTCAGPFRVSGLTDCGTHPILEWDGCPES